MDEELLEASKTDLEVGKSGLDERFVVGSDVDQIVVEPAIEASELALRLGRTGDDRDPPTQQRTSADQQRRDGPCELPLSTIVLVRTGFADECQDRRMRPEAGGHLAHFSEFGFDTKTLRSSRCVRQPRSYVLSPSQVTK